MKAANGISVPLAASNFFMIILLIILIYSGSRLMTSLPIICYPSAFFCYLVSNQFVVNLHVGQCQCTWVMGTGTLVHSLGSMNLSPMILWFLHSGSSCQLPNGKPIERVCISGLSFTSLRNASVKSELGTMLCSIYAR